LKKKSFSQSGKHRSVVFFFFKNDYENKNGKFKEVKSTLVSGKSDFAKLDIDANYFNLLVVCFNGLENPRPYFKHYVR